MSFESKRSCIAIDVSKGTSHFQGFYSAGVPASAATSFEHTKSGFARVTELFNFLKEQNDQKPFIIFEHTGTYSRPIEVYCKRNNFSYMAIPPLLSAKMRKSDIRPTKTDKIDCATIANVYYLKRLRVTKSNSKVYSDLKTLCSYYNFKVQLMVQMKVKYREHLDLVYPRIDTLFGVYTNTFLDLITRYPNPHKLQKKSKKELTEFFIKRDYCGLPKAQRLAILVKEYFKDVEIPVTENDVLITIFSNHLKELRFIMNEVDDLLERIITLGMKTKEYPYLMSIPGIQSSRK